MTAKPRLADPEAWAKAKDEVRFLRVDAIDATLHHTGAGGAR